ncbi:hypothetical protein D3C84_615790 [compost metagenome]
MPLYSLALGVSNRISELVAGLASWARRSRVFSSRYSNERKPSAALARGGAARKPSLKISSDRGPV